MDTALTTQDTKPVIKYAHKPPMYDNPAQMEVEIVKYFDKCFMDIIEEDGSKGKKLIKAPTLAGMAVSLGFSGRASLADYEKRNNGHVGYAYLLKKARSYIEDFIESGSIVGKLAAIPSIFALKNHHGWVDKQEVEVKAYDYRGEHAGILDRAREIKELEAELGMSE